MVRGKIRSDSHYYSEHLQNKLDELRLEDAAVIEAPSGYGKTTAVRDTMENSIPEGTQVCWFTARDEHPTAGFHRLCREIEQIDPIAGQRLLKIEFPNAATVGEACSALQSIKCQNHTYLVIDNFQFLSDELPNSFVTTLLDHGNRDLHIIIVTQMLRRNQIAFLKGHGILHITAADLRLNSFDIRKYYSKVGVLISQEDAQSITRATEGWMAAVYLHLCAFLEQESFFDGPGILPLMEHLVWDVLSEKQQDFLLRVSPFDTITLQQACTFTECSTLPAYAQEALSNPFIRYDYKARNYEMHSILSELLTQKRRERGAAFDRECLLRAGDYCRDCVQISRALDFYSQAGDYEHILMLDLSKLTLELIGDRFFWEIALGIAQDCPHEIKCRYPLSMLRIAWALLAAGMKSEFDAVMEQVQQVLEAMEGENSSRLRGEWLLLSSWRALPRLQEMIRLLKQAAQLFGESYSQVILPSMPWGFGDYSQMAMFHSTPGEVEQEADALEEYIAIYSRLTRGHGIGADVLLRAEIAHYRGDLNESEILCYKADFLAENKQQSVVQLGVALHLAEIAVEHSDTKAWQRAINSMEQAASYPGQTNFVLRSSVEILRGVLLNEINHQTRVEEWLKNGERDERLLPAMQVNALFVRLGYLMQEGQFALLAGTAEAGLEALGPDAVLADTLFSLMAAIGYMSLGNVLRAEKLLEHAARQALPDNFVYLFAVYHVVLKGLPEKLIRKQYPEYLPRYNEIKDRFSTGYALLHTSISTNELPTSLTCREREVAELAAQGLHNSEIAEKLMVTKNTVRFHLRTVFQKLDIDRRAKLAEKLK